MKPSDQNAPRRHVHPVARLAPRTALVGSGLLLACAAAHAGMVTDAHGNVGYESPRARRARPACAPSG